MFSKKIEELKRYLENRTINIERSIQLQKCVDIYKTLYQEAKSRRKSEDKEERTLSWMIYVVGCEGLPSKNEEVYKFLKEFLEKINTLRKNVV